MLGLVRIQELYMITDDEIFALLRDVGVAELEAQFKAAAISSNIS